VRAGLAIDASHPMLHLRRSRQLAARGEGGAAIGHLESAFSAPGTPPGFEKVILLFAQDPSYGKVREDLRFQRVLLRAAAS
jgi:hypothetical protein